MVKTAEPDHAMVSRLREGLERLGAASRTDPWAATGPDGLNPTQAQALLYLANRDVGGARIKDIAAHLIVGRAAGWPVRAIDDYGEVVTVQAIIGAGNRTGVTMVWGPEPIFAHVGLDLTGPTGGVVRIDDIVVEDVTQVFLRNLLDVVDVRDYGAIGNGVANDIAAFQAADAAAAGRTILVSPGTYLISGNLSVASPIRYNGTLTMPAANRLVLTRNFDLETYAAGFGGDQEGFRRALQALFYFSDHVTFDMSGRRVDLTAPVDVAAVSGLTSFATKRILRNGTLNAVASTNWATTTVTSVATYSVASPTTVSAVANVANVPVGALVQVTGGGARDLCEVEECGGGDDRAVTAPVRGGGDADLYVQAVQVSAGFRELLDPVEFRDAPDRVQLPGDFLGRDDAATGALPCPSQELDRGDSLASSAIVDNHSQSVLHRVQIFPQNFVFQR